MAGTGIRLPRNTAFSEKQGGVFVSNEGIRRRRALRPFDLLINSS